MTQLKRALALVGRQRRWLLAPLLIAALLLALVWWLAPAAPLGRFVYGPR